MPETPPNEYRPGALPKVFRALTKYISKFVWRIEYLDTKNIPANDGRGLLIVSNHQTYIDPFWLSVPILREVTYLAWDVAFTWPVVGRLISSLGAIPVSLEGDSAISTIRTTVKHLRMGSAVLIFPEGEREYSDGKLLPLKDGAARLATLGSVDVLPVRIEGGNRVWPQGWKIPRPAKVKVYYRPVIPFEEIKRAKRSPRGLQEVVELIKKGIS